jgi:hypothetical protein
METFRKLTETLARTTTRRNIFGKGAGVAAGALLGVAAGSSLRPAPIAEATASTVCIFPGPACPCGGCQTNGLCQKPCIIMTLYYNSGCWVTSGQTCCDCDCNGQAGSPPKGGPPAQVCGCGTDYHAPGGQICPKGS